GALEGQGGGHGGNVQGGGAAGRFQRGGQRRDGLAHGVARGGGGEGGALLRGAGSDPWRSGGKPAAELRILVEVELLISNGEDHHMSQAVKYTIDPAHSTAGFKVRHLMVSNVRGEFSGIAGTVEFDPDAPENSRVDVRIDASTIHTRDDQRDAHLKSADFLDVAKFPEITFVSRKITGGGGEYKVTGDLTIHGVTREVTLDVEGPAPE